MEYSSSQYHSPASKDKNLYNSFADLRIKSPEMADHYTQSHISPVPGSPEHGYSYLGYESAGSPRPNSASTLAYSPSLSSRSASPVKHNLLSTDDDASFLRKSTTTHWRNLADASDKNSHDLHLPGVTEDAEEIHGMHGRLRLQKTEDAQTHVASRNWMDKQRKYLQAYEYLCHIGEAKEWIEQCIEEEIPSIVQLEEALRDGVILAKLTKAFAPELVRRIFENPKLQYRHTDNINYFFKFTEEIGMPDVCTFFSDQNTLILTI